MDLELIWSGKHDADGRPSRPDAASLAQPFRMVAEVGAAQTPSPGRLIQGDNLTVMASLLQELGPSFDLLYLDPPFMTQDTFHQRPDEQVSGPRADRMAYDDRWASPAAFLSMMADRLHLARDLLSATGSLYLHCDWRTSAMLRLLLDEIFSPACFLNEIVWSYGLGGSSPRYWPRKHDTILWYARTPGKHFFEPDRIPATSRRMAGQSKKCPDVWDIPTLNNMAHERVNYPTQKPMALLERIVRSSCPTGGLVGDFFSGSGTTGAAAQQLSRRWVLADQSDRAISVAQDRLSAQLEGSNNPEAGFVVQSCVAESSV